LRKEVEKYLLKWDWNSLLLSLKTSTLTVWLKRQLAPVVLSLTRKYSFNFSFQRDRDRSRRPTSLSGDRIDI